MNVGDILEKINNLEKIKNVIKQSDPGTIFISSDFANIANNEVIRKNLSLLTKRGFINRISHGLYIKPEYGKLTNELIPFDIDKVANAIARNHGWKIIPFGQTALNILGLSNQVPTNYEYLSDGPYRSYEIDGYNINFMHRANKDLNDIPYKTALIISAIRALGKGNVANNHIEIIKSKLSDEEEKKILDDTKYITKWVRTVLETVVAK